MDNITLTEIVAATKAALGRLSAEVNAGFEARKEKEGELQARISHMEKPAARPPGPGGAAGSEHVGEGFGASASTSLRIAERQQHTISLPDASAKSLARFRAAALTGANLPPLPLPPVQVYHPALSRIIDLLQARPMSGNAITFNRIGYSDNSPPGNQAAKVSEGETKPESTIVMTPVTIDLAVYAHFVICSKMVLDDVGELAGILDFVLTNGLLTKLISTFSTR
jgi:hypothetical protein